MLAAVFSCTAVTSAPGAAAAAAAGARLAAAAVGAAPLDAPTLRVEEEEEASAVEAREVMY
jgi:hypothetical protein